MAAEKALSLLPIAPGGNPVDHALMTRTALHSAILLLASGLPILAACADPSPNTVAVPVRDMTTARGPGNGDGWIALGSTPDRPALSLYGKQRPIMVLTCEGTQTQVQVRGLVPMQAWPQPDMVVRFGDVSRRASPDLRNIGEQVAYELSFRISDDVIGAIRKAEPISVAFNDQSQTLQPVPGDKAREFADRCEAMVPAGMRRVAL